MWDDSEREGEERDPSAEYILSEAKGSGYAVP